MGRRRRRKPSPRPNTFVVAAVDSLDRVSADYVCNGVADEAEINLAFAALGIAEGSVLLMEGTFTLAASIAFTANNQDLIGQGRSTYIDGTALGAGVHAIVLSGFTHCTISNLAVETNAGGGVATHCIFIEDGTDNFHVSHVTIVNSDDDGIHVEGTTITQGHIHLCHIEAADGNGIHVDMDALNFAYRIHVEDNDVVGCGGIGIHFGGTGDINPYCQVILNVVYNCTGNGILVTDGEANMIRGNICINNGANGIEIQASDYAQIAKNICQGNTHGISFADSDHCTLEGNVCSVNTGHGILISAASTYNIIAGNNCDGNGWTGIALDSSGRNILTGNICSGNTQHGIFLSLSHTCTVNGNLCIINDSGSTGNYDGINIDTCDQVLVVGNRCYTNFGWGIMLDDNANYCKVSNNTTEGNNAGSINVNGAPCDGNEVVWNTVEEGAPVDTGTLTRASGNFDPSANAYIAVIGAVPF